MAMVDTMSKVFIEDRDRWNQQQDKRDRIEVRMLDSVYNLGYEQYLPQTKINTLAGGLFGLLVGVIVIFFLEWLELDTIRTPADVERAVGVAVLGAIPPISGDTPHSAGEKRRQLVPGLHGSNRK
jgi:capsular polysaccharide biosynthesis protein